MATKSVFTDYIDVGETIEIKNNSEMKRYITQMTTKVAQKKRSGEQIILSFQFACLRGDGEKMVSAIRATKTGVPLSIEVDTNGIEVLGWWGVNYDSKAFLALMDFAYKVYDEAHKPVKAKAPVKSNAPSYDPPPPPSNAPSTD